MRRETLIRCHRIQNVAWIAHTHTHTNPTQSICWFIFDSGCVWHELFNVVTCRWHIAISKWHTVSVFGNAPRRGECEPFICMRLNTFHSINRELSPIICRTQISQTHISWTLFVWHRRQSLLITSNTVIIISARFRGEGTKVLECQQWFEHLSLIQLNTGHCSIPS